MKANSQYHMDEVGVRYTATKMQNELFKKTVRRIYERISRPSETTAVPKGTRRVFGTPRAAGT